MPCPGGSALGSMAMTSLPALSLRKLTKRYDGGLLALELGRVPLPGAQVTWDGLQLRAEGGPDHRGRLRIGTVLVSPTAPDQKGDDV